MLDTVSVLMIGSICGCILTLLLVFIYSVLFPIAPTIEVDE